MLVGPFWSVGSAYSDALAPLFFPSSGPPKWRQFAIFQALPLFVLLPWAYFRLSESPAWLRASGRGSEWRNTLVVRLSHGNGSFLVEHWLLVLCTFCRSWTLYVHPAIFFPCAHRMAQKNANIVGGTKVRPFVRIPDLCFL